MVKKEEKGQLIGLLSFCPIASQLKTSIEAFELTRRYVNKTVNGIDRKGQLTELLSFLSDSKFVVESAFLVRLLVDIQAIIPQYISGALNTGGGSPWG